jgi:hypothetical protein
MTDAAPRRSETAPAIKKAVRNVLLRKIDGARLG